MKSSFMLIACVFALFSFTGIQAQDLSRETIKVWGNCGMCKEAIEKATLSAGAEEANWSIKKKKLTVGYNPAKTNLDNIQQAIADAGYDTRDKTASQEAYNNLPGCCKYDRKDGSKTAKASCCGADAKSCKHLGDCAGKDCCKDGKMCKDHKACEASGCCPAGHASKASCCSDAKSCKHLGDCAGKDCCKDGKMCKDHKACEASGCCAAASKDDAKACCKDGAGCADHKACTEKGCCAGKSCCKS